MLLEWLKKQVFWNMWTSEFALIALEYSLFTQIPKDLCFSAGQLDQPGKVCFIRENFWDSYIIFITVSEWITVVNDLYVKDL